MWITGAVSNCQWPREQIYGGVWAVCLQKMTAQGEKIGHNTRALETGRYKPGKCKFYRYPGDKVIVMNTRGLNPNGSLGAKWSRSRSASLKSVVLCLRPTRFRVLASLTLRVHQHDGNQPSVYNSWRAIEETAHSGRLREQIQSNNTSPSALVDSVWFLPAGVEVKNMSIRT